MKDREREGQHRLPSFKTGQMNSKTINGRTFEYGDEIIHTTTTRFGFWDRIKILFGKEVTIQSCIYAKEPVVSVMGSEARTSVASFIKPKQRGGYELCTNSASPE